MAIKKEKKQEILSHLAGVMDKAKTVVFVNFHKLLVKDVSEIRRSLKKEEVGYRVAKKTLLRKTLENKNIKGEMPVLSGELSIVYGEDLIAPARSIYEFQKKLDNKVSIMGGIFDGEYKSQDEMVAIAAIPSLQTLRGMFVNIVNSPIQRFVIALDQVAGKKSA